MESVHKPDALTKSSWTICIFHKYYNNKHLIPARDGHFTPAKSGQ